MQLTSVFLLYIEYYESKIFTEKCTESWTRYSSFYWLWITGKLVLSWLPCNVAKTYWKSNGCFTALCCTNNERLCLVGDELWDVTCTMVKNQTGYDILMVMISLSPLVLQIHWCIDGYNRRVVWLNILRSNKDPKEGSSTDICCWSWNGERPYGRL